MNPKSTSHEPDYGLVVIQIVAPEMNAGGVFQQVAAKSFKVEAEIVSDQNDALSAGIRIRREDLPKQLEAPMHFLADNRWRGEFLVTEPGCYFYRIEAWMDRFKAWRLGLQKELRVGRNVSVETLLAGAQMIEEMVGRATALDAERLLGWAEELRTGNSATGEPLTQRALDESLAKLMTELAGHQPGLRLAATREIELRVKATFQ